MTQEENDMLQTMETEYEKIKTQTTYCITGNKVVQMLLTCKNDILRLMRNEEQQKAHKTMKHMSTVAQTLISQLDGKAAKYKGGKLVVGRLHDIQYETIRIVTIARAIICDLQK